MKALSLWQPWASLVIVGAKQFETRSWKTSYRGTLVIHAALTRNAYTAAAMIAAKGLGLILDTMPRGVALGTVELVDVCPVEAVMESGEVKFGAQEWQLGDYSEGRYAWKLANPIAFPEPIACAGHQRLWDVGVECVSGFPDGLALVV